MFSKTGQDNSIRAETLSATATAHYRSDAIGRIARQFLVGVILLLGTCVFFYRISAHSMWLDEFHHKIIAERSIPDILAIRQPGYEFVTYSHGYYIVNHLMQKTFSGLEFAVRAPEALSAVIVVLLTYLLGRHCWGGATGVLAALLLIGSLPMVEYAQQNRFYQMGSLGYLLSCYCYARFLERQSWLRWFGLVAALSFLLRVHTYAVVMVGLLAPATVLLWALHLLPSRVRPYDVTRRTVTKLMLAAIVVALLWMPFTVLIVQHALRQGTDAALNDSWWQAPFPLSLRALMLFVRDNFSFVRLAVWEYGLILAAATMGTILYRKGRGCVLFGICVIATFIIIHMMNASHAVVMPKRLLYLLPFHALAMAAGVVMLARITHDGVTHLLGYAQRNAAWLQGRRRIIVTAPRLARVCGVLVALAIGVAAWRGYVWPEIDRNAAQIGQYYFTEYERFKLLARLFAAHLRPTDELWWSPSYNSSWLIEQSSPPIAMVRPKAVDAAQVTRADIDKALQVATGVWLHDIDPAQRGFQTSQFVHIPILDYHTYLIRPAYLTNPSACLQDRIVILKCLLNCAAFPHVAAAGLLIDALQQQGLSSEAQTVAENMGAYRASRDAVAFAAAFFEQHGDARRARQYWYDYADCYFWHLPAQELALNLATQADDIAAIIRCARRMRLLGGAQPGRLAQAYGLYYYSRGDYARALPHLQRAFAVLTAETPAHAQPPPENVAMVARALTVCASTNQREAVCLATGLQNWRYDYPLMKVAEFTNTIGKLRADKARWKRFARDVRHTAGLPAAFAPFVDACEQCGNTQALRRSLLALREKTTLITWPVYVYAMAALTPTAWRAELLIPPCELRARGFMSFYHPQWQWIEQFYLEYGGLPSAIAFHEWWRAVEPDATPNALLRQCELEAQYGTISNIVPRLSANFALLAPRKFESMRSVSILQQLGTPDASNLCIRFQSSKPKD